MLSSLPRRFAGLPNGLVLVIGLACVAAIAWLDYITDPRIPLSVLYLLPVMLVAWATASTGYGLVVAVVSCLVAPAEVFVSGFRHESLAVAAWKSVVCLAVFCIALDLMERLRALMTRLQEQALSDELTGLANLRAFREVAAKEIERSSRFRHELSLAYVDIDDFKGVNDRLGHDAGDRMLIALASLALVTVRAVDIVARIGGDEFVILMPETGAAAALPLALRLRESFARAGAATCSIGLASFERTPTSVEEMLAAADALMYKAKEAGKDTVRHRALSPDSRAVEPSRLLAFPPPARA